MGILSNIDTNRKIIIMDLKYANMRGIFSILIFNRYNKIFFKYPSTFMLI